MPPKRRKKSAAAAARPPANNSSNNVATVTVANERQNGRSTRATTSVGNTVNTRQKTAKRKASAPANRSDSPRRPARRVEPMEAEPQDTVRAIIEEGSQPIEMEVSQQTSDSSSEADSEIYMSLRASQDTLYTSEGEVSDGDDGADSADAQQFTTRAEVHRPWSRSRSRSEPRATTTRENATKARSRIERIDAELKQKIHELHGMMKEGGLTQSAQLIEKTLMENFAGKHLNTNANATMRNNPKKKLGREKVCNKPGSRHGSHSEETIYKSAVGQRFSSSSDELVDTSDELLRDLNLSDEQEEFFAGQPPEEDQMQDDVRE